MRVCRRDVLREFGESRHRFGFPVCLFRVGDACEFVGEDEWIRITEEGWISRMWQECRDEVVPRRVDAEGVSAARVEFGEAEVHIIDRVRFIGPGAGGCVSVERGYGVVSGVGDERACFRYADCVGVCRELFDARDQSRVCREQVAVADGDRPVACQFVKKREFHFCPDEIKRLRPGGSVRAGLEVGVEEGEWVYVSEVVGDSHRVVAVCVHSEESVAHDGAFACRAVADYAADAEDCEARVWEGHDFGAACVHEGEACAGGCE